VRDRTRGRPVPAGTASGRGPRYPAGCRPAEGLHETSPQERWGSRPACRGRHRGAQRQIRQRADREAGTATGDRRRVRLAHGGDGRGMGYPARRRAFAPTPDRSGGLMLTIAECKKRLLAMSPGDFNTEYLFDNSNWYFEESPGGGDFGDYNDFKKR